MSRLAAMDEHYRQTLTDNYLDGLTYLEISLRDNIPVSTVKSRAQRGLRKLQIEFASLDGG